jgi:hypothetical protein
LRLCPCQTTAEIAACVPGAAEDGDLQLLGQFGRPAFAYSGAQGQLLPIVERAPIVSLYADVVGGCYRDYSRIAPYNLYARTRVSTAVRRPSR